MPITAVPPTQYRQALSALEPESFRPHRLHSDDPDWANTNCYLDVWIELLWSLELDPLPLMSSAVSAQFVGDQWEFLKPRSADLEMLYGIRFGEYPLWKPITEHLATQSSLGNLMLVEVDSFYLPDTAGTTYRREHGKTTVLPVSVDTAGRSMNYFHNSGFYRLDGTDFDATVGIAATGGFVPSPYVDLIEPAGLRRPGQAELLTSAEVLLVSHLRRVADSPHDEPMAQLAEYLRGQLVPLAEGGLPYFHRLAFATTRQAGLSAMLAAEFCRWLFAVQSEQNIAQPELLPAAEAFSACSTSAKQLQFKLARVACGRSTDTESALTGLAAHWATAIDLLQNGGAGHG